MSSFTRFAGVAVVLLSLGFLVTALPATRASIPAITGTDAVSVVCAELFVKLEACINALSACKTYAELEAAVNALIVLLKGCTNDLITVGADVVVEAEAKTNIVTCVVAAITLLLQVCLQISVKFGITVVAVLLAKIDVCLKELLVALNICIEGIVIVIVKALGSVAIGLLVKLNLNLCLGVLGITL